VKALSSSPSATKNKQTNKWTKDVNLKSETSKTLWENTSKYRNMQ
jgi:hypothetical protein